MLRPVAILFRRLHDRNAWRRRRAERALASLTPADKDAVPQLVKFLQSERATERFWAARGLVGIGPGAQEAVEALVRSLADENAKCRFWSVCALSSIAPTARSIIEPLLRLLRDPDSAVRSSVVVALRKPAFLTPEVMHSLVEQFQVEEEAGVRAEIARSLGRIDTPEAISALISTLADPNPEVRRYTVIALKVLGAQAIQAKESLQKLAASETDEDIRVQAEVALRLMETPP